MYVVLVVLVILILFGGIGWGYRGDYGPAYYGGGGLIGLLLVVLLIMALLGYL